MDTMGPLAERVHTPLPFGSGPPEKEQVARTLPQELLLLYSHVEGPCVIESGMQSESFHEDTKVPGSRMGVTEVREALAVEGGHTFSNVVAVESTALTVMVDSLYATGFHTTRVSLAASSGSMRAMVSKPIILGLPC